MLPTKFRFIWSSGFRGDDFFKSANQKQELPKAAMFVNGLEVNEQSCPDLLTNMAATGNSCFWLVDF
jgi:hypothetical protein